MGTRHLCRPSVPFTKKYTISNFTYSKVAGHTADAPNKHSMLPLLQLMPAPVVPVPSTVVAPALHTLAFLQSAAPPQTVYPPLAVYIKRTAFSVGRCFSAVHSRLACYAAVCDAHACSANSINNRIAGCASADAQSAALLSAVFPQITTPFCRDLLHLPPTGKKT